MRRVVVTGMGGITALGENWESIKDNLQVGKTATRYMPEWEDIHGMNTKLAAPIPEFLLAKLDLKSRWPRKKIRTMGPVSLYALFATEQALKMAGLEHDPVLQTGRVGVAYGSCFGSVSPMEEFAELLYNRSLRKVTATSYIRMMSHTAAVNIGLFYKLTGRIIPTSTACTSGSLSIGYAFETIRSGVQDIMLAGGAEEICPSMSGTFDVLYATSTCNSAPEQTPKPYDQHRDGIVIGEGSTTLVLEEYERAIARGATIYAEIVGFGTNTDGNHVTQPSASTMETSLRLALADAKLSPEQISIVNGHGTATEHGDIAESIATNAVLGTNIPMHSLKSYFGHTLGACGALESWLGIEMMQAGWAAPTANLVKVDDRCAPLDYIMGATRTFAIEYLMSNNFAFGGINTSLIFKKWKK